MGEGCTDNGRVRSRANGSAEKAHASRDCSEPSYPSSSVKHQPSQGQWDPLQV